MLWAAPSSEESTEATTPGYGEASESSPIIFKRPHPGALTPSDLRTAYNLPIETAFAFLQTIAVIDAYNDPTVETDLATYDKEFGLPACTAANGCLRVIDQKGQGHPLPPAEGEWASETSADIQLVHAICQQCHLLLVEADGSEFTQLGAAVNTAAAMGATVINNSYESSGEEASEVETLSNTYYYHPGTVVTASAGDCGFDGASEACAGITSGVSFPASSPYVVAVGGTSLRSTGGSWGSVVWPESGGGCSSVFAAPSWQVETASWIETGCGNSRLVTDVAAVGDPSPGIAIYDSTPITHGAPRWGWRVDGGTSVASPIIAAEFALAGGARGVNFPAHTLYSHIGDNQALYDLTVGANGVCGATRACQAMPGYDGPSGVGSPVGLDAFQIPGSPINGSPPMIMGLAQRDQRLVASIGEWFRTPTSYNYQWARCNEIGGDCYGILGATAPEYTLNAADVASTVRLQVTAGNAFGVSEPVASTPTPVIRPGTPTIRAVKPYSGITGSQVSVTGTELDGVMEVRFGSYPADFEIVSSKELTATVPNGAKPGAITVVAPVGRAASAHDFRPTLSITAFSPTSSRPGRWVTIHGIGFRRSSTVTFGASPATAVEYLSSSLLRAKIPVEVGAGPITVSNNVSPRGVVVSAHSFSVATG